MFLRLGQAHEELHPLFPLAVKELRHRPRREVVAAEAVERLRRLKCELLEPHLEEEARLHKHLLPERLETRSALEKVPSGQLGEKSFVAVWLWFLDKRCNEWAVGECTVPVFNIGTGKYKGLARPATRKCWGYAIAYSRDIKGHHITVVKPKTMAVRSKLRTAPSLFPGQSPEKECEHGPPKTPGKWRRAGPGSPPPPALG